MVDRPGVQVQQCIQLTGTNITFAFSQSFTSAIYFSLSYMTAYIHFSLVMLAAGIHPVTFRTRQLSLFTPKILGFVPGK
ncbi:hypothetical protein JMUB4039_2151 [Leptotrichia trevisanii]|nr:hypothetical protein JMUB4039_1968 [Leptotrichia trevisanii]BBM58156.1 hypothetical protein JMUB4039_2151 [Leptotrichia trevisanii]